MKALIAATLAISLSVSIDAAGILDSLGLGKKSTNLTSSTSGLVAGLSQDQVIEGLKEALGKGVQNAVSQLGHDGGFLTNLNVKIPMPDKLHAAEKTLRALRQDRLVDDFVNTMNHAAEQAVPEAATVFAEAVRGMSIEDAKAILTGPTNAATQYFRRATQTNLFERFLPVVKKATDQVGVTSAYKQLMEKAGGGGGFGALSRSLFQNEALDVDAYVTNKALDGLFHMIAEEEGRIRENPVARTSDLLQKVFGAVAK
jgi:hypothetical protein